MIPHNTTSPVETSAPRLPVYLLLDCSGTMYGENLTSVSAGVSSICDTLRSDPRSAATVHISVIWFNDQAYQTPLVPISAFAVPELRALGRTALGAALRTLNSSLDNDLQPIQQGQQDYRPLVFLLTDGRPSDDWQVPAANLRERTSHKPLHVVGLAIGDDADVDQIAQVATVVLKIDGNLQDQLREYFDWVADSVILAADQSVEKQARDGEEEIPALPPLPTSVRAPDELSSS